MEQLQLLNPFMVPMVPQEAALEREVAMGLPVLMLALQSMILCAAPMEKHTATSVLWKWLIVKTSLQLSPLYLMESAHHSQVMELEAVTRAQGEDPERVTVTLARQLKLLNLFMVPMVLQEAAMGLPVLMLALQSLILFVALMA